MVPVIVRTKHGGRHAGTHPEPSSIGGEGYGVLRPRGHVPNRGRQRFRLECRGEERDAQENQRLSRGENLLAGSAPHGPGCRDQDGNSRDKQGGGGMHPSGF